MTQICQTLRYQQRRSELQDFLKALQSDPSLASKLKKSGELSEFKGNYGVEGASGLKCPVCTNFFQSPGSLWWSPSNPNYFVCRKCRLVFTLQCANPPIPDVIKEIKAVGKGEQAFPSWMKGNIQGGED